MNAPRGNIAVPLTLVGLFGALAGIVFPTVALQIEALGGGSGTIGFAAAVGGGAALVGYFLGPFMIRLAGPGGTITAAAVILAAAIAVVAIKPTIVTLCAFRGLFGLAAGVYYVAIELILVGTATQESRGVRGGAYEITRIVSQACGPLLLALFSSNLALIILGVCVLVTALVLHGQHRNAPAASPIRATVFPAVSEVPAMALLAAFTAGAMTHSIYGLAPVALVDTLGSQSAMLAAFSVLLVAPTLAHAAIVYLSARLGRIPMIALLGGTATVVVPAAHIAGPLGQTVMLIVAFSCLQPFYILGLAHANDASRPDRRAQSGSAALLAFGLGSMVGPAALGAFVQNLGVLDLLAALGVSGFVCGICGVWWWKQRRWTRPAFAQPPAQIEN